MTWSSFKFNQKRAALAMLAALVGMAMTSDKALAANRCSFAFEAESVKGDLWSRDLVSFNTPRGERHFTFSFDSEFLLGDAWNFVLKYSTPERIEMARGQLNAIVSPITLEELAKLSSSSEKQARAFLVRKDIPNDQTTFQLSDLNAGGISIVHERHKLSPTQTPLETFISEALVPTAESLNLPVEIDRDGYWPEMRHETSETSPRKYKTLIGRLHKLIRGLQTHFHLGLPADLLSIEQAFTIARIVEVDTLLKRLIDADPSQDQHIQFAYSALAGGSLSLHSGQRGFVKIEFNHFTSPFQSHDLEIRDHRSIEDGFEKVELAVSVAKLMIENPGHSFPEVDPSLVRQDPSYGAALAALNFAANALALSEPAIARELASLISEANESSMWRRFQRLDRAWLTKASKFLTKNEVDKKYRKAITTSAQK